MLTELVLLSENTLLVYCSSSVVVSSVSYSELSSSSISASGDGGLGSVTRGDNY